MDHFVDIQLLPDPELPTHVLRDALYAKLHLALVMRRVGAGEIAVSFPRYSGRSGATGLGDSVRLLGSRPGLQELAPQAWLGSLRDLARVTEPADVPGSAMHRSLRRVQAKSNVDRLRRRQMKRHGIDEDEARRRIPEDVAERLNLPFLHLRSTSTGQGFKLFLRLGPAQGTAVSGAFNTYGLSATATIPWF